MNEKVVLIGAGSAMFTRGLVADTIRSGWRGELALVDTDEAALAVARGLAAKMLDAARSPLKLTAATDRRAVLGGATVVVCTIAVGGRRAWVRDVEIPRAYGVYQPVGDTVMPGGASRALRMIPPMIEIVSDAMDIAPDALLFNYANPMSAVCRAVRKATNANVIGLCHGVPEAARYLAQQLGIAAESLSYSAAGINHLTWLTNLRIDGRDAADEVRRCAREKLRAGSAARGFRPEENPFTWQLVGLFGAFPAVMDRHVTEFFPHLFARRGAYFGKTLGLDAFNFDAHIRHGDEVFEEMRREAMSERPLERRWLEGAPGEQEQLVEIVESCRRGDGRVYSANLANEGQIPNLPAGAVVECPAAATGGTLTAIAQPPLPAGLAVPLASRALWAETVVEAALEGSREKFVQALLLDGAVDSAATAQRLADDLLEAHREHLPQFR